MTGIISNSQIQIADLVKTENKSAGEGTHARVEADNRQTPRSRPKWNHNDKRICHMGPALHMFSMNLAPLRPLLLLTRLPS